MTKNAEKLLDERHPYWTTKPFNPNATNSQGQTIAHVVAHIGNVDLIDIVNTAGVDWNAPDSDGFTPAHYAAVHPAALRRISDHGGLMSKKTTDDESGTTPLEIAIEAAWPKQ